MIFTVKTMAGDILPVEYEPDELTIPGMYHCVLLRLRDIMVEGDSWNIELIPPLLHDEAGGDGVEAEEAEEALLDIVKQGGMMYLLIHTGRRLATSIHRFPFGYRYEGKQFIRCRFDAEYTRDGHGQVWSIDAYLRQENGSVEIYHAKDVVFAGHTIVIRSMDHPCTGEKAIYDLMLRGYEHEPGMWSITPFHLLPSLYQEWSDALESFLADPS